MFLLSESVGERVFLGRSDWKETLQAMRQKTSSHILKKHPQRSPHKHPEDKPVHLPRTNDAAVSSKTSLYLGVDYIAVRI